MRAAIFAILATAGLMACETVKGVGEDVQNGGERIEEAAS